MAIELDDRPLFSTLAEDPEAEAVIDDFVLRLAERIDALQDVEAAGALDDLAVQLTSLRTEAEASGFDFLARCAEAVEAACRQSDSSAVRKELVELTGVARRVRLGHKGAF
jgi:hypothetical protein